MMKLGIIGYPLGHSLSPVMHKAALEYMGIEGEYNLLETDPEELIDKIKLLRIQGYNGFNVTIPLKVWIVPFLNEVDDYSNILGAVNTVLIKDDHTMHGYNTDIHGFVEAIPADLRENLKSKKAAVFGVGGASRAVAIGLAEIGLGEIIFYARDTEKASGIVDKLNTHYPNVKTKVRKFNEYADLSKIAIAINSTPLGMEGINIEGSPVSKRSVESLPKDAIVYDLVYKPRETNFIKYAKECGLTTIDGVEMLVLQGAKALSIWTGQNTPIEIMRNAVIKSL